MLGPYIPILVMLILATVVAVVMVVGSLVLGPKHPTRFKGTPYECGVTPVGSARERFPIQFYLVAMLFIIFDIETIFLYPWAVVFRGPHTDRYDKLFLLGEMGVFVAILFVGYFYIWGKGGFDWNTPDEDVEQAPNVFRPRAPIRFGNENSGAVRLGAALTPAPLPHAGEGSQEPAAGAAAPTGGGR